MNEGRSGLQTQNWELLALTLHTAVVYRKRKWSRTESWGNYSVEMRRRWTKNGRHTRKARNSMLWNPRKGSMLNIHSVWQIEHWWPWLKQFHCHFGIGSWLERATAWKASEKSRDSALKMFSFDKGMWKWRCSKGEEVGPRTIICFFCLF